MANLGLRLEIKFDTERFESLLPSAAWAVVSGVLTEEEAVEALADDLVDGMQIVPILETKGGE